MNSVTQIVSNLEQHVAMERGDDGYDGGKVGNSGWRGERDR